MKIRQGFVSNSSSSSFVCDVCGEEQSGMDLSLSEVEMHECQNGHTFCDDHMKEGITLNQKRKIVLENEYSNDDWKKAAKEMSDEEFEEFWDEEEMEGEFEIRYECPPELCPICQFQTLHAPGVALYWMKKQGVDEKSMLSILKKEFGTYEKFKAYIKESKN